MAMVPVAEFGSQAAAYVGTVAVNALANRVASEIENFDLNSISNALSRLAPGKRNKAKRKAARNMLINRAAGGGRRNYSVSHAPVAYGTRIRDTAPKFRSSRGEYHISNREYVGSISGNSTYAVTSYPVQPGMSTVFPWLSKVANTHQKYTIRRIKFTYIPSVGTDYNGRVVLALAMDPLDPEPINKAEIFQYGTSIEDAPWKQINLVADAKERNNSELFVRRGYVDNSDIKTYDHSKLFVAVSNCTDTNIIGDLFVDYEIALRVPKPSKCVTDVINTSTSANYDDNNVFGDETFQFQNIDAKIEPNGRFTFANPGSYLFSTFINLDGGTAGNITVADGTAESTTLFNHKSGLIQAYTCKIVVSKPNQFVSVGSTGFSNDSVQNWVITLSESPDVLEIADLY